MRRFGVTVESIDQIFNSTNKMVGQYLLNQGLPITFDFSNKFNKAIYTHYFLNNLCEYIRTYPYDNKLMLYNDTLSKDVFRNSIIKKVKRIFGIKIWNGVWDFYTFVGKLKDNDITLVDQFEVYIEAETKPKTFRHIKKYLEKEGFKALSDNYFKDIANKMAICS